MGEKIRGCQRDQQVLATDLDGTFIPLSGNSRNRADLKTLAEKLCQKKITLTFVTGRHLESVQRAIVEHALPRPDWIICDVGSTIYECVRIDDLREVVSYRSHLDSIVENYPIAKLREYLGDITELRLQEPEKQGRFKLSYYTEQNQVDTVAQTIQERLARTAAPYSLIHSVDPFNGDGLVDLLPKRVSKAYALQWWVEHAGLRKESIVYAGDSGNDLAAFLAGYRTIVVGNTDREIADRVYDHHSNSQWHDRLCLAKEHGTSGVLEGCCWFEMFSAE